MSEGESALPSQEWCDSVNTLLSQTHHSPPSLSAIGCVLCFCLRRFTLTGWIRRLVFEWKRCYYFCTRIMKVWVILKKCLSDCWNPPHPALIFLMLDLQALSLTTFVIFPNRPVTSTPILDSNGKVYSGGEVCSVARTDLWLPPWPCMYTTSCNAFKESLSTSVQRRGLPKKSESEHQRTLALTGHS